jgi:adenylosuccinate synthase
LQWGDEAKGKLVDLLSEHHDLVVRYQGGSNAGHTVVRDGSTFKLSLIPSGILSGDKLCVVTGGVVFYPKSFLEEVEKLAKHIDVEANLVLSDRAHVIFPWHILEDAVIDKSCSSGENLGVTMRGIGPCYAEKVNRSLAFRLGDLLRDSFRERLEHVVEFKNRSLAGLLGASHPSLPLDAEAIYQEYRGYAERLRPLVADTTALLLTAVEQGRKVLFEGAQGALLDIDHGTYPFVTSSNSSGAGVSGGSGVPGRWITKVIGVVKAYSTRVGGGPFPTELHDQRGADIRTRGKEFGTVTGRPRRCGWFDAVAVRYTARLSGVDSLAVMLLDVLSELPELKICTAYEIEGRRVTDFPSHVDDLRRAVPVLETLPGWQSEITEARSLDELPSAARAYLDRISELVGRPIEVVSVGPDRSQTIFASEVLRNEAVEV